MLSAGHRGGTGGSGRSRLFVGVGWAAAAVLAVVATLFPVMIMRSPYVGTLGSPHGDSQAFSAVTTFDAWGRSSTVMDPPHSSPFEVTLNGPNYGVALLACVVVLFAAAASGAFPGKFGLPGWVTALGPVAAGTLAGVGGCQILAFEAASHPFTPAGVTMAGNTWLLGQSPWIVLVGALVALATWTLTLRETGVERRQMVANRQLGPAEEVRADKLVETIEARAMPALAARASGPKPPVDQTPSPAIAQVEPDPAIFERPQLPGQSAGTQRQP